MNQPTNQIQTREPQIVTILQAPNTLQELAKALPHHLSVERFARIALTEVRKNQELAKCTPGSFMGALVQAAQLGLEPGSGLGLAYLIPYRNNKTGEMEATFIPGYRGLLQLARNSGNVKKIEAFIVYDGDVFDYWYGLEPGIKHRPCGETSAAGVLFAYAACHFSDGTQQFEVMTRKQIDAIRDRGRRNPVWNSDYEEMARKTVLRRLCKHLPMTPALADALTIDNDSDQILSTPARAEPQKFAQLAADDASDQTRVREEKEHLASVKKFDEACHAAQLAGVDVEKVLGVSYDQAMSENANFLEAAAEKLAGWKPEKR